MVLWQEHRVTSAEELEVTSAWKSLRTRAQRAQTIKVEAHTLDKGKGTEETARNKDAYEAAEAGRQCHRALPDQQLQNRRWLAVLP